MISREVEVARYKDVCGGEKRRVNISYINYPNMFLVENNELQDYPKERAKHSASTTWEILAIPQKSPHVELYI